MRVLPTPRFEVMAEGLGFPEGPVALPDGSVILSEIARRRVTRVRPGGAPQVVAEPSGGPNGLAVAPDGSLWCCNGGGTRFREFGGLLQPWGAADDWSGGRVERIDPVTGAVERVFDLVEGHPITSPNDLCFDAGGGCYVTDLGKSRGRVRHLGGLAYAAADGAARWAAWPVETANGVGLSPDGRTVHVAETITGRLWSFPVEAPGRLALRDSRWERGRLLAAPGGQRPFDGLAVEAGGAVCAATLVDGGVTRAHPDGALEHIPLPDAYVTNICFGGRDARTAFVTLSSRGLLLRVEWDAPGLLPRFHDRIAC